MGAIGLKLGGGGLRDEEIKGRGGGGRWGGRKGRKKVVGGKNARKTKPKRRTRVAGREDGLQADLNRRAEGKGPLEARAGEEGGADAHGGAG